EIQEDLAHRVRVGEARGDRTERRAHPDAVVLEVLLHELERARDELVHVDRFELRARLAGELEQVLDDRLRAADLLLGDAQVLDALGVRRVDDLPQVVERVHDDRQRIAQLVGDAGRELTDGRHLLGLDELALEALSVRDVDAYELDPAAVPVLDVAGVGEYRHGLAAAGGEKPVGTAPRGPAPAPAPRGPGAPAP